MDGYVKVVCCGYGCFSFVVSYIYCFFVFLFFWIGAVPLSFYFGAHWEDVHRSVG